MRRAIVESPYAGETEEEIARNVKYARLCFRDCFILRKEAPFASHLLYTQPGVLDDNVLEERTLGIEAGLIWGAVAEVTVVYHDFGVTKSMKEGITDAEERGRPVEYRRLPEEELRKIQPFPLTAKEPPSMTNAEIIKRVNKWQENLAVHPLTCVNNSTHLLVPEEADNKVILICPVCDYSQEKIPPSVLNF